jgi:hypothetical protein
MRKSYYILVNDGVVFTGNQYIVWHSSWQYRPDGA